MKNILSLFFAFLLAAISFGQNIGFPSVIFGTPPASSAVSPICRVTNPDLTVIFFNTGGTFIDFSTNLLTVDIEVSKGGVERTYQKVVNTGTLGIGAQGVVYLTETDVVFGVGTQAFDIVGVHTVKITIGLVTQTDGANKVSSPTVTVFEPEITYDGTSGSKTQSICKGIAITPIKYNLSGSSTGVRITGLPSVVSYES